MLLTVGVLNEFSYYERIENTVTGITDEVGHATEKQGEAKSWGKFSNLMSQQRMYGQNRRLSKACAPRGTSRMWI